MHSSCVGEHFHDRWFLVEFSSLNLSTESQWETNITQLWNVIIATGLYSSRARWPVVPNFCSWATRKSYYFHENHMLGALDFTSSEHWAPLNFSESTTLCHHTKRKRGLSGRPPGSSRMYALVLMWIGLGDVVKFVQSMLKGYMLQTQKRCLCNKRVSVGW